MDLSDDTKYESVLEVIEIRVIQEAPTGNPIHQIVFGKYVSMTSEALGEEDIPEEHRQKFPYQCLTVNMKTDVVNLYPIGSKWTFTRSSEGTITLTKCIK